MSANGTGLATESSNDAAKDSAASTTGSVTSAGGDSKSSATTKSAASGAGGKPKYTIGDLVWAKMKGFSPWPGKVVAPNETTLKKPPGNLRGKTAHVIFFFGSNNYGWIPEDAIQPYEEFKEKNSKLNKSASMKEAIAAIEEYIRRGGALNDNLDAADSGLPSIDDELSTIFPDKKGKDKKDDGETLPAPLKKPVKGAQRDYSRTPFKSKLSKTKSSDEDSAPPPAKRARGAASKDSADAAPSAQASAPVTTRAPPQKTTAASGARNILARTSQYLLSQESAASGSGSKSEEGGVDLGSVSDKNKNIKASTLKFGFIGLGLMGQRLLKNLLNSGHSVTIWNRTPSKCKDFLNAGAQKATTPADVVAAADVTFCCLADPQSVKEIVFGNCGVLAEIRNNKGYVEMTNIDPETANDVSEAIIARGGRYLEAPIVSAGKAAAEAGNLTVIAAGDKQLFDDCQSCIEAISNHAFYLGSQVGDAAKMNLVLSMLTGNLIGSLAESMALADRTGLQQKDLLEISSVSPLNCAMLIAKGKAMIEGGFATEMPLTHMQKDLRLALGLGETFEHPLPITASTNEVFKHAKHLGYSEHDVAAVYIRSRF